MTLFGFYALLVMIVSLFIVIPPYFFIFTFMPKSKAPFRAHKVSRFWAKLLFTCFFIKVEVKGKERIKPKEHYVFVCNHRSQLDIPLFAMACVNPFRFLAKVEVTRIPLVGYVVKKLYITVDRKNMKNRVQSFVKMQNSLVRENISMVIFPEGTRNRTEKPLIDFKDGAFRLAIETKSPIAALAIFHSGELSPADRFMQLKPGTLKAIWTEPIPTHNMSWEDAPLLKEQVRKRLLEALGSSQS